MSILFTLERLLLVLGSFLFATARKDTGSERLPGGLGV